MTAAARTPQAVPEAASHDRYSAVAVVLHWLIAAAILFQVSLAWRMTGPHTPESFAVTQLHKSVGITILLLSFVRLGWRLANPPPPLPAAMARWEKGLAHAVHVGLYVIMIGMPLTGWLMVSASRIAVPTLLYGAIPWPNLPGLASLAPVAKETWRTAAQNSHELLADFLYVLFLLHVGGALKHQLFSRDEPVLGRMAPGAVAGRWLEPRLIAVAASFVAIAVLGKVVTPPRPAVAPPITAPLAAEATPATAAPPPAAPTAAPPKAAPGASGPVTWTVLPGSTLGFATSWGGQALGGRFKRWTADVRFAPQALDRSKASVAIDLASVDTGDAQRDAVLPSADWFDAANHPKAVFTATRFEKTGPDRYLAHGTLELRGVTRPQDLPFRLTLAGDEARVTATTMLDRTAFGVGQGEFAATDQIPGKVTVTVALRARRAGG